MKTHKLAELEKRIGKLEDVTKIQCTKGNYDANEYMRGVANGLILATAIMNDKEPKYFEIAEQRIANTQEEIFNIILKQKPRGLLGNHTGGGSMIDAYPEEWKLAKALAGKITKPQEVCECIIPEGYIPLVNNGIHLTCGKPIKPTKQIEKLNFL